MIGSGTVIDGRYEILQRVGSGGMADVYEASDELLGRRVAVKVLHHRFAEDQEFVERFRREASSAAGLSHPNVVAIFDRGSWDHTYYIAMEYLPGRTLKQIVREGPLPAAVAIDVILQILRAARFAHRRGVIHRDLKPHNVILDEEGRAKVTDFGIARAGASDMTLTGSIMGTAQYLSPEQAQGHMVTEASDLYAIGVVLYELLTGRVPFDGETAVTIALQHISSAPPPPSSVCAAVPTALDAVVLTALAKDPTRRYTSADAMIEALEAVRAGLPEPVGEHVLAAAPGGLIAAGGAGAIAGLAGVGESTGAGGPAAGAAEQVEGVPGNGQLAAYQGATDPPTGSLLPLVGAHDGNGSSNGNGGDPSAPQGGGPARGRRLISAALLATAVLAGLLVGLLIPASGTVKVPRVAKMTRAAAVDALRKAGLHAHVETASSAKVPSGEVVSETPAAGVAVEDGSVVSILVSSGPGSALVPDVTGLSEEAAIQHLTRARLKPTRVLQSSDAYERGVAIATKPPVGTPLKAGSPVQLLISSGRAKARVPELLGKTRLAAEEALEKAGLRVGGVHQRRDGSHRAGTVIAQLRAAGSRVDTETAVGLVVAQAPPHRHQAGGTVRVPSVLGQSRNAAFRTLRSAGLTPEEAKTPVSTAAYAGIALKQQPGEGHRVALHSTVKVFIGVHSTTSTTTSQTSTQSSTSSTTSASSTTGESSTQSSTTAAGAPAAPAVAGSAPGGG